MFIDKAEIIVKGGDGGAGSTAFRREKFIPRGGPNGGDGGRGGDVYLRANDHLRTLLDFARKTTFEAPRGEPGSGYLKYGASGDDLILDVPCGTAIYRGPTLVADMVHNGDKLLIARGGRGGRGNVHFKSSVRQAPRISEIGEPGEKFTIRLQLKLIADVGLVGFPNGGKSTLLSRLTRAHPKIANYPFTTLHPNLGVTTYHDREIIFADIPGLIEGSHQGKGLGHEFLNHVERTRVLVHVVDPMGFDNHTPAEGIKIINNELKSYSKELAKKPQIIVVNKQDLTGADKIFKSLQKSLKSKKVIAVSGVSGEGIQELLKEASKLVETMPLEERPVVEQPLHIQLEPEFWVEKHRDSYLVRGKKVERLVAMTNFRYDEAIERTQNIMKKMGVERELLKHGALVGDKVVVGSHEFTFEPKEGFADGGFRKRSPRDRHYEIGD
jgi:GTP-binding protein